MTSPNSVTVAMTGSNVLGASHDIATNTLKVIQTTPITKALPTNAMEFTVYAFGQNQVTLSGASFKTMIGAYGTG